MLLNGADEVLDADLQASADYYDGILNDTLPHKRAEKFALERFGVVLEDKVLNRILEQYACTPLSLEDCVRTQLQKHN